MTVAKTHNIAAEQPELPSSTKHFVNGRLLHPPYASDSLSLMVGMGCYWGAERLFWQTAGVLVTAVGFAGGTVPHPSYKESCNGKTGHAEVVLVVYSPQWVTLAQLLQIFWQNHDPTQGDRQGNDRGTQYRSSLYLNSQEDYLQAIASRDNYQSQLTKAGFGKITTEIANNKPFYFAHEDHQQYLARHPDGYCGIQGTGVACPIGIHHDW